MVVALLLLSAAAGAVHTCNEDLCPQAWVRFTQRGDGICDLACNTLACGLDGSELNYSQSDCSLDCASSIEAVWSLGNGVCEEPALSTEECGWGGGDCGFCARDCKHHLGFESDLGNEKCTDACSVFACAWDGGDCVRSMQGFCNSGCFEPMLGDGVCQSQCFTPTCHYDQGDCDASLCEGGCYPGMQDDGTCQSECYSEACMWDGSDCDCSPGCVSSLIGDDHCDESCYTEACEWDLQDCECAAGCKYSDLGQCKAECLVPACNYDSWTWNSSPCLPDSSVFQCSVSCGLFASIVDGNFVIAFRCPIELMCCGTYLSVLLTYCDPNFSNNSVWPANDRVLPDLTSAQHPMEYYVTPGSSVAGTGGQNDPFQSLSQAIDQANLHYVDLLLTPGEYVFPGLNILSTCYDLMIDYGIPPLLLKQGYLPLKQLRIRSQDCLSGSPNCLKAIFTFDIDNMCYVNLPTNITLEIIDAVFVTTTSRICYYNSMSPCSSAGIVVPTGSVLHLTNVTFQDLGPVSATLIRLIGGRLYLTNVHFIGVIPQMAQLSSINGVIASNSSAEVVYQGGSVELLNKDAYSDFSAVFMPFLNLRGGSVRLNGVHFRYNIVKSGLSLILLGSCHQCIISNCTFEYNLATIINYTPASLQLFSSDWKQAQAIAANSLQITDCVFRNNTGRNGASVVVRFSYMLNTVVIRNCSFLSEYSETYGVVSITSAGYSPLATTGFWKYDSTHKHNISFPAIAVTIQDSQFLNCTVGSYGILHISQLPNVVLSNVTFRGHGNFGNVDVFTNTYRALPTEKPDLPPASLGAVSLSTCLSIISITNVENLRIAGLKYENFNCSQGVYLFNCTFGSLTDVEIRGNEGSNVTGSVLLLNFSTYLTVSGLFLTGNRNTNVFGQGTVAVLGTALSVHISKSRFEGNVATYGSALYLKSLLSATVSNSLFLENAAASGGAIALEPSFKDMNFTLIETELRANSAADLGGAIAVLLVPNTASLCLRIALTQFLGNRGLVGSALYISALIPLQPESSLSDSYIAHNQASKDATLYLSAGYFRMSNTSFVNNTAQGGAALYQDCITPPCVLSFSSVSLFGNTGESMVSLSFTQPKSFSAEKLTCSDNHGKCIIMETTSGFCRDCLFRGNQAVSGAVFHIVSSNLTCTNCQFEGNSAKTYGGAGLIEVSSWFACHSCSFTNNSADRLGGALYVHSSSLALSASAFTFNSAQSGGFAMELYRCSALTTITATAFMRNHGDGIGVLSLLSASLSLDECSFEGNWGSRLTGGIHTYTSNLTVYKCTFRNQTSYSGNFLYMSQNSWAYIEASNFSEGVAVSSGGAATIIDSAVSFERCHFRALSGPFGAALSLQSNADLKVRRCVFMDINVTSTDRGVISGYRSTAGIYNSSFVHFSQSALSGQGMDELRIEDSAFVQASGNNGGAVLCMGCTKVHIVGSKFKDLQANAGGALYLAGNSTLSTSWTISNSTFDSCIASSGGAVYAKTCALLISNCSFLNNSALGNTGKGGAILLAAEKPVESAIRSTTFVGNSAGLKGGGVCWEGSQSPPSLLDNQYQGNTAQYGSDVASFVLNFTLNSSTSLLNVASGQTANVSIVLDLMDHYGQLVTIEKSSFAQISSGNAAGTTRVPVVNGRFTFSDYAIISTPGTNTSLSISTTALATLVSLHVQLRNCTIGEALTNGECVPCVPNSYNLEAGVSCKECPEEAQCLGNFTIVPKAGYWRASSNTERFFECPHAEACKGYPEVMELTGKCAEGYEGNKCETCSKDYFRWSRIRCSKCPSSTLHSISQLGLWAVVLLLLVIFIKLSLKSTSPLNSVQLKIFLNYLQLVMLFDSFHLAWPELMLELFNAQEAVGGFPEYLFSFSCLYEDQSELQTYYRKWVVLSLLLPLLVLVSCCVWLCIAVCKKSIVAVRNEMVASAIILFFMAYPSVMRVLLGVLHCEEILPGEYWVVGLDLRCWQSSHLTYALGLALPCLLIWGIGIPALVFLFLYRQRHQIDYTVRYSFLTTGYSANCFYWEYVVIYRKLLIIVFIVFFSQVSLFLQVLSTVGLLLASITLQNFLKPYSHSALNSLELWSLIVATLTLYSGLFFYSERMGEVGQTVLFVLISLLNLTFTVVCFAKVTYLGASAVVKKVKSLRKKGQVNPSAESEQAIVALAPNPPKSLNS